MAQWVAILSQTEIKMTSKNQSDVGSSHVLQSLNDSVAKSILFQASQASLTNGESS